MKTKGWHKADPSIQDEIIKPDDQNASELTKQELCEKYNSCELCKQLHLKHFWTQEMPYLILPKELVVFLPRIEQNGIAKSETLHLGFFHLRPILRQKIKRDDPTIIPPEKFAPLLLFENQ